MPIDDDIAKNINGLNESLIKFYTMFYGHDNTLLEQYTDDITTLLNDLKELSEDHKATIQSIISDLDDYFSQEAVISTLNILQSLQGCSEIHKDELDFVADTTKRTTALAWLSDTINEHYNTAKRDFSLITFFNDNAQNLIQTYINLHGPDETINEICTTHFALPEYEIPKHNGNTLIFEQLAKAYPELAPLCDKPILIKQINAITSIKPENLMSCDALSQHHMYLLATQQMEELHTKVVSFLDDQEKTMQQRFESHKQQVLFIHELLKNPKTPELLTKTEFSTTTQAQLNFVRLRFGITHPKYPENVYNHLASLDNKETYGQQKSVLDHFHEEYNTVAIMLAEAHGIPMEAVPTTAPYEVVTEKKNNPLKAQALEHYNRVVRIGKSFEKHPGLHELMNSKEFLDKHHFNIKIRESEVKNVLNKLKAVEKILKDPTTTDYDIDPDILNSLEQYKEIETIFELGKADLVQQQIEQQLKKTKRLQRRNEKKIKKAAKELEEKEEQIKWEKEYGQMSPEDYEQFILTGKKPKKNSTKKKKKKKKKKKSSVETKEATPETEDEPDYVIVSKEPEVSDDDTFEIITFTPNDDRGVIVDGYIDETFFVPTETPYEREEKEKKKREKKERLEEQQKQKLEKEKAKHHRAAIAKSNTWFPAPLKPTNLVDLPCAKGWQLPAKNKNIAQQLFEKHRADTSLDENSTNFEKEFEQQFLEIEQLHKNGNLTQAKVSALKIASLARGIDEKYVHLYNDHGITQEYTVGLQQVYAERNKTLLPNDRTPFPYDDDDVIIEKASQQAFVIVKDIENAEKLLAKSKRLLMG